MAQQRVRGSVFGSKSQDKFILHRRDAHSSGRWLTKHPSGYVFSFPNLPTARAYVGNGYDLILRRKNSNWKVK
jgi:hypothetical protein